MKLKFIQVLLLLAIAFNITHAAFIATEDHCEHESVSEYLSEQFESQDCDDLCDIHHLFHLTAIITPEIIISIAPKYREQTCSKLLTYHPPFKRTEQKPPIA
jgi:hypothetical protein